MISRAVGQALRAMAVVAVLLPAPASALPADASCVYLAIGCYAPSPVPAPAFPDALFAPIPVPSIFNPPPAVIAVPAPEAEVATPAGALSRHRRKPLHRRMPN